MNKKIQIELTQINKHYGTFHALKDINLSIPKGQFVALVGPSGCGKSTLLRTLAGLEKITGGEMQIGGQLVNDMPPRERDVAMVFQSYALYPHMTVQENLTYSLRMKGASKSEQKKAAQEVAQTIGLEGLLDRYPKALSGGQRQRVAMGRAIVRRPKVFLFDEPLSNLDAALRVHMRKEIRSLHDRLGATSVYVTHDQIEAMTMADHVVVLRDGIIEQQGAPLELYDKPASDFVGGFIGSPAMNFVNGTVDESGNKVSLELDGDPKISLLREYQAGLSVRVGLRPEFLQLDDSGPIRQSVAMLETTGTTSYLTTAGDVELVIMLNERKNVKSGDVVGLSIKPDQVHIFDKRSGMAL